MTATRAGADAATYPGQATGLPETGPGSLASWKARLSALVIDWGLSWIVAVFLFGGHEVITGTGWQRFMPSVVFLVSTALMVTFLGASVGKMLCRIVVVKVGGGPVGPWGLVRQLLLSMVLPALVIGVDRRGLHDLAAGSVVVNRT